MPTDNRTHWTLSSTFLKQIQFVYVIFMAVFSFLSVFVVFFHPTALAFPNCLWKWGSVHFGFCWFYEAEKITHVKQSQLSAVTANELLKINTVFKSVFAHSWLLRTTTDVCQWVCTVRWTHSDIRWEAFTMPHSDAECIELVFLAAVWSVRRSFGSFCMVFMGY